MGRYSKFTPEVTRTLVHAIRNGLSDKDACELSGISQKTLYKWLKEKKEFKTEIEAERVAGKLSLVEAIRSKQNDDWRAAAWLLSHRYPGEYSERRIINLDPGEPKKTPWELMTEVIEKGEKKVN